TQTPDANLYDIDAFVAGEPKQGLVGKITVPAAGQPGGQDITRGWHDFYVGYDPASHQDRFYGAGAGGYYVFDVSDVAQPKLLTSITGVAGVSSGHTFTPTPDGRYA